MRHGIRRIRVVEPEGGRKSLADHVSQARQRVGSLIGELRDEGLRDDEIRRVFEAELLGESEPARKR